MLESSIKGVKILRSLALAIRSEQDYNLISPSEAVVGILKERDAQDTDAIQIQQSCGEGYRVLLDKAGYVPLSLRTALDKIAHADPSKTDYYVAPCETAHELLLYGNKHGQKWFAAISIFDLIKVITSLPDAIIDQT